ncbi:MAG: hypothetical protein NC395_06070 [Prevotella sp.]|nr:hypothetical protein [Prevotella sp.]
MNLTKTIRTSNALTLKKIFCVIISLIIMTAFSSCDSGDDGSAGSAAYYKDDTVPGALNTYLNALMNDDYETYLKITRKSDSDSNKTDFNDRKKGYTSVDSISYGEVTTSTLFNLGASAEYMVAEYNSDGTLKENYSFINGEKYSYGLVVVKQDYDSGTYYISTHQRGFNFNY